jgi:hypothetical protein
VPAKSCLFHHRLKRRSEKLQWRQLHRVQTHAHGPPGRRESSQQ